MSIAKLTERDIVQAAEMMTGTARIDGEPGNFVTVSMRLPRNVSRKPAAVIMDQREAVRFLASIARQVRTAWPAIGDQLVAEALRLDRPAEGGGG